MYFATIKTIYKVILNVQDKIRNINNFKQRGKIQVFNKYMKYTKAISYALFNFSGEILLR